MNSKKIELGEVYQIKHSSGKDYDFDTRYPAHDGPGLVLEVQYVHGAFSGRKRADGTFPKQVRRRGIIRYMDRSGNERIVGAECAKKPWKDQRTAEGLRKTYERKQQERKQLGLPVQAPEVVAPVNGPSAYDVRRVLDGLRKKEQAASESVLSARGQLTALEADWDRLCATIEALEQAMKEITSGPTAAS